jgi:hypothetical protein
LNLNIYYYEKSVICSLRRLVYCFFDNGDIEQYGKLTRFQQINQIVRDTVPQDTTKKAEVFLTRDTVPDKKDTTKKLVDLSVR